MFHGLHEDDRGYAFDLLSAGRLTLTITNVNDYVHDNAVVGALHKLAW